MTHLGKFAFLLLTACALCAPAHAQTADDYIQLCSDPHPDVRLLACSVVIELKQATGEALASAYASRGTADLILGSANRAIADFSAALMLAPNRPLVYGYRGEAYLSKGDNDDAIADFTQALQFDASYIDAYYGRAGAWRGKGETDKAIDDYSKVVALDPDYVEAYAFRGLAYRAKDDLDRAIADFSQVIRLNSADAQAYNLRGGAYRDKGDGEHALADFDLAVSINPRNTDILINRGFAELLFGRYADGAADFAHALELQPAYAYNALWLDLARRRAGQPEADELARNAATFDATAWPAPLLKLYGGQSSAQDVRAAAAASGDAKAQSDHACEAAFYIGELALARGEAAAAKPELQAAVSACPHTFLEYSGAVRELAGLP
jgi:lipoprotein NlpI